MPAGAIWRVFFLFLRGFFKTGNPLKQRHGSNSNLSLESRVKTFFFLQPEGVQKKRGWKAFFNPSPLSPCVPQVKRDYIEGLHDTLDLVPIGAWHGNGRKTGWWVAYIEVWVRRSLAVLRERLGGGWRNFRIQFNIFGVAKNHRQGCKRNIPFFMSKTSEYVKYVNYTLHEYWCNHQ